jgi:hypothetical protein
MILSGVDVVSVGVIEAGRKTSVGYSTCWFLLGASITVVCNVGELELGNCKCSHQVRSRSELVPDLSGDISDVEVMYFVRTSLVL